MNKYINFKLSALTAVSLILLNSTVFAEDTAPFPVFDKDAFIESAKNKTVLKIGLAECIAYAFKNNSEIKIVAIEPKIKTDDVKIAQSEFEPTFGIDYLLNDNTQLSTMPFITGDITNETRTTLLNGSIKGKLTPGTMYELDFLTNILKTNSKYQAINPAYSAEPQLTITQPVLRGFGIDVNRAGIVIAQNNKEISSETFKNTVIDIISSAKTAYYKYIHAIQAYIIAKDSLKRAHDLLKINRARYKKGLISSVDILETETAVAEKIKFLIAAESNLKSTEDNLKLVTNLVDDPSAWNAKLDLTDMPEFTVQKLDLVKSLLNAFQYRSDYQAKKIELENRDVIIMVNKNALLPTLDLIGSFGLNGLGDSYGNAINSIDSEYKDWSTGVKFSIPWGGGDRARYDKSKLEKGQALIGLQRMEQKIILDVRDKVREVDLQYRQVRANRVSRQKEQENYKAQMERYRAGQASTHDILDYQNKLSLSELTYTTALIDYNIAVINLDKAEGLTLARNNIKLEE